MSARKSPTDEVTIHLPRNVARLLVPAVMDRMTMMSGDLNDGRISAGAFNEAFLAHSNLLDDLRVQVER